MEKQDLQKKSIAELHTLLAEKRSSVQHMLFSVANAQLKNVREVRVAKKEIAQILTELNQRAKVPVQS